MKTIWPVGVKPPWSSYTPRGLHGPDASHHVGWLGDTATRAEHMKRLGSMAVSNMTVRTASDSILEVFDGETALEHLLKNDILPIIRVNIKFPGKPTDWLEKLVRYCAVIAKDYGIERLPYILGNEPNDDREWRRQYVPPDWKEVAHGVIMDSMWRVWNSGGAPGYPDPLGEWDWFFTAILEDGAAGMFAQHKFWWAAHLYNKNRPLDYPMDPVSLLGVQLTEEQHKEQLGDFYDLWKNDPPLKDINQQRREWANPDAHWKNDATCHGAWRNIRDSAMRILNCEISIANTEGGPTPKSPAGDDIWSPIDNRYVHLTPDTVAEVVLQIEQQQSKHGLWAHCNWLYLSEKWAYDAWVTGAYRGVDPHKYWLEMPAVSAYALNDFGGNDPPESSIEEALYHTREALDAIRVGTAILT